MNGVNLTEMAVNLRKRERLFGKTPPDWLLESLAEAQTMETRVKDMLAQRRLEETKAQLRLSEKLAHQPFPPPGSLLAGWMEVLSDLELQLLEVTRELAAALKGKSDQNLFDLLATINQLLDILAKLHQKASTIYKHTLSLFDRAAAPNDPPLIKPELLLGNLAAEVLTPSPTGT